ncbi:MAG: hypothetical protein AB8G05_11775 [Oligoflexales bacterium]
MHKYDFLRQNHSKKVCQTIDKPITVFDYFELGEVFAALVALLIFGIIIYSWQLMLASLFFTLGLGPYIRRRNKRGIYFHYPYKQFGMNLPGLINPKGRKKYSD